LNSSTFILFAAEELLLITLLSAGFGLLAAGFLFFSAGLGAGAGAGFLSCRLAGASADAAAVGGMGDVSS